MNLPNFSLLRPLRNWMKNVYVDNGVARVSDGNVLMVWEIPNCEYKGKWCVSIKDWNFLSKYKGNTLEVILDEGFPVGVKLKGDNMECWVTTQPWNDEAKLLFSFFEDIDFADKQPKVANSKGLHWRVLKAVLSLMPKNEPPVMIRDNAVILFIGKTFIIAAMTSILFNDQVEQAKKLLS